MGALLHGLLLMEIGDSGNSKRGDLEVEEKQAFLERSFWGKLLTLGFVIVVVFGDLLIIFLA